jgi:hypothetical protein
MVRKPRCPLMHDKTSEAHYLQTSMFVPDPVISLAIKPTGTETPNFSRALNRFQKEDPTFRVHVDHESKEVCLSRHSSPFHELTLLRVYCRRLSRAWESYTLRSTLNG